MTRARPTVPLAEVAQEIAAAFEGYADDLGEESARGGRLFRAELLRRLRDRYGEDWVRAWDHQAWGRP